jgi:hypothetical protein
MAQKNEASAQKIIDNLDTLKSRRSNYDSVNQDITDYVLPNRGDFTSRKADGEELDRIIFDSTAITANMNLASVISQGLTDPTSIFFRFRPKNSALADKEDVKRFLQSLEEVVFNVFSSIESGFPQQNHELLLDLGGYGTSVMFIGDDNGKGNILFQTRHLSEIWIEEDNSGQVDTVYREFEFTVRQAAQEFGEDNLGTKMKQALMETPHKKFKFIHVVMPKEDYERSVGPVEGPLKRFDFISLHLSVEDKNILKTGGFDEQPYIVVRWVKRIGEVYGISPSWNSLSDIKMINGFAEVGLKSAQKQVDPPILMSDDGVVLPLQTFPGGVNIGGLNDEGKEMMKPLLTGQNNQILAEVLARLEIKIEKAFSVNQFSPRQGVQPLTATEDLHNQQKESLLIAPQIKRIQDEYLTQALQRVIGILSRKGKLPVVPEVLLDENGSFEFDIEYIGPLAFNQQSNRLLSYNRFFANVGTFVEFKPETMANFDIDRIVREGAEISGIPLKQLKTEEEVAAQRAAEAQAEAQEQQQANVIAGAETAATLQKSGIPVVPTE